MKLGGAFTKTLCKGSRDIKAIKHTFPYIVHDHRSCFGVIYTAKGCAPKEKWIYLIFDRIWNLILVDALTLASVSKTGDFPHFSKYPNLWARMLCNFSIIFFFLKSSVQKFLLQQRRMQSHLSCAKSISDSWAEVFGRSTQLFFAETNFCVLVFT